MTPYELRYLQVLYRYLAGPVQQLASDANSAHQLKAIAGVVARLIAGAEAEAPGAEYLTRAILDAMPDVEKVLNGSEILAQLHGLLARASTDRPAYEAAIIGVIQQLAEHPSEIRAHILERLVSAEWENWNQIETRKAHLLAQAPIEPDSAGGNALSGREAALTTWLRAACNQPDDLVVSDLKLIPGGFSKQTAFLSLQNTQNLSDQIVLRLDRPESPLQTTVIAEFPLLKVLHAAGVRVPRPLALDREVVAGAPLMAVERLHGRIVADGQHFLEEDLPFSCALSLAQQLATYHQIPIAYLPPELPGQGSSVREIMAAEIDKLRTIWRESRHQSIVVETAFVWLSDNLALAGQSAGLVHGDLRFHNVLISGGEVSAILDWETASIGHPGFDLGYVYGHIIQLGGWREFLEAYETAGGEVPSQDTLRFYVVRTELFIVVYLTRMAAAFQAGAFEKIDLGYAAIELRQHAVFLLAERLRAALAGLSL